MEETFPGFNGRDTGKGSLNTGLRSNGFFVAAGFSLRRTGETPVPPRKVGRKIFDWSQLETSAKI